MEIKKISTLLLFSWSIVIAYGQSKSIDRTHLYSASATFSPGVLLKNGVSSNYLHGFFEYYPQATISLKGDVYLFLKPAVESNHPLSGNSGIFYGGVYHFNKNGAFDPYIGLQPGISYVDYNYTRNDTIMQLASFRKQELVPMISGTIGINYYVSRYFNFFGSVRYIHANGAQINNYFTQLNEFRFSFGLGFNFAPNKNCDTCPSFGSKKK